MTVSVPSSSDTTWTPYFVPGGVPSSGRPQILMFSIAVADGSDAALEIDNVVFRPPSPSSAALSLVRRYSFNDNYRIFDSMASWYPPTMTLGSSATISSGQLQLPGGSTNLTRHSGSYLQFTDSNVFDSPGNAAPTAVSIEMWVTIASRQSDRRANAVLFELGSISTGTLIYSVSMIVSWNESARTVQLSYFSVGGALISRRVPTPPRSASGSTTIQVVVALANGASTSTSAVYVYGKNQYNSSVRIPDIVRLPSGSSEGVMLIGAGRDSSQPALIGSVDEFRVWSGALSQQDITEHYAMGPDYLFGTLCIVLCILLSLSFVCQVISF